MKWDKSFLFGSLVKIAIYDLLDAYNFINEVHIPQRLDNENMINELLKEYFISEMLNQKPDVLLSRILQRTLILWI
jgi:hypothetical protein